MRTRVRIALLLPALLSPCLVLAAQDGEPPERVGSFVEDASPQPLDTLTSRCPAPPGLCDFGYPVLSRACAVKDTTGLGTFGGEDYVVVRYLRETVMDEGAPYGPFTCGTDEVALAALSGDGRARVVWRDATDRVAYFISSVDLHRTPGGERVLSITYCLNGTGGCAQGLLIWDGNAWRRLERDDSWDAAYRTLPAGYRRHKSAAIDLEALTWRESLAGPGDPNCCPSGYIDFRLAIIGGKLAVKSYDIAVPEEGTGK